jgi:hypothetical protein
LALGIVAPPTVQGTTFKKYGGAYSWTIINSKSLNLKDNAFLNIKAHRIMTHIYL